MHIKLKLADLKEIQSILNEMKRDTENAITVLKQNTNTATNLMGSFNDAKIEEIHQRIEDLEEISLFIGELEDKIDEIIEVVEFRVTITDEEAEFIYDAEKLTKTVNEIQELLDINSVEFKSIINNSEDYKYWERQTTAKLDNPDAGLKDIVEEMKQRDDEKVFRHNRKIMQGLSAKMEYSLINTYIEDILEIKEELDALEELDDIEELAEIILNATSYGDVNTKSSDITVDNYNEVRFEKAIVNILYNTNPELMKEIEQSGIIIDGKNITLESFRNFFEKNGEVVSVSKNTFDMYLAMNKEIQIDKLLNYYNVEYAGNMVEFSINYNKLEELQQHIDLDGLFEYLDTQGIEGIYYRDDFNTNKIPSKFQGVGKYLEIGERVIVVEQLTTGISEKDWSKVGGATGGVAAVSGFEYLVGISTIEISLPVMIFASIGIGILGQFGGEKIGEQFEK